jgi:hypothetical protein
LQANRPGARGMSKARLTAESKRTRGWIRQSGERNQQLLRPGQTPAGSPLEISKMPVQNVRNDILLVVRLQGDCVGVRHESRLPKGRSRCVLPRSLPPRRRARVTCSSSPASSSSLSYHIDSVRHTSWFPHPRQTTRHDSTNTHDHHHTSHLSTLHFTFEPLARVHTPQAHHQRHDTATL